MKRLTRKRGWDSGGVSEVVSTILILGLTVLLFSSIIAFVGRMPAPTRNTQVSFIGRVQPSGVPEWSNGAEVFITHIGGRSLVALEAKVIITINGTSTSYDVATYSGVTFINNAADDTWDPSDVWKIHLPPLSVWPTSTMDASVVDMERNTYVWGSKLQGGNESYAPLIMDAWADSDLTTLARDPIQNDEPFTFYVRLSDPNGDLNTATPTVDLSHLLGPLETAIPLTEGAAGVFQVSRMMGTYVTHDGYYPATVRATDMAGHVATRVVLLTLGREIGARPEIHLSMDKVFVNPQDPQNGDDLTLEVTVSNYGGGAARINLTVADRSGSWWARDTPFLGISDQITEKFTWRNAGPGGNHIIFISAVVTSPVAEPEGGTTDNYLNYTLTILPTVLLVDDDQNDGGDRDSTRYLREALDSGGFEYDMFVVPGGNGPAFNSGMTQLISYDVVVWNCGYENAGTLTAEDRTNLGKYLADTTGRTSTGSLWMIGQSFLDDPSVSASTFASTYLHLSNAGTSASLTTPLAGNPGHPVARNWSTPVTSINTTYRLDSQKTSTILGPGAGAVSMFNRTGGSDAVSYENDALDSRIITFGWDFSRIADLSVQTDAAYAVILWLGNLTEKNIIDFAVTGQTIEPEVVYYKEQVTVTAWIRNNGAKDDNVSADVALDGAPLAGSYNASIFVPGHGGKVVKSWTWNASSPGVHTLVVRVDPDGAKTESNENNNQAGGLVTATTINVLFRLLVVDDDESPNNGGVLRDETGNLTKALDGFACKYEQENVSVGSYLPDTRNLGDYNVVIWVSGDAANSIAPQDQVKLADYFNKSGRVWLQGKNSTQQSDSVFMSSHFGVGAAVPQALPDDISGITDDELGHGIHYGAGAGTCDAITPAAGATGYILSATPGRFLGVRVRTSDFSTVLNSFSLLDLADGGWQLPTAGEARKEIAFLVLDWFGRPETRSELKVSCIDVKVSDLHPQIGNSYVLQATVRNLAGYAEASALVRFMDENTTIGSDSIGISPDNETTAEIIWRPLATGSRTIRVLVDPLNETGEVFEWFNNNASYETKVYFFFDDMESGTGKWEHEATLLNINSEGPLNFLGASYTNVKTDVKKDWDYGTYPSSTVRFTSGVTNTSAQYHSYNESYYMEEPQGVFGTADVLVAIVLDNSPSMTDRICTDGSGRTLLEVTQDAAASMVNAFSDNSVVGVYHFQGANERPLIGMTLLAGTGRENVTNMIYSDLDQGNTNTAIWDAIGLGWEAVQAAIPTYPEHFAAVVALTDGFDLQSADSSSYGYNKLECGSDEWAPWGTSIGVEGDYPNHWGKYWYYQDQVIGEWGEWIRAGTHGGAWFNDRKGLLYSDVPMFTIGVGIEHYPAGPASNGVASTPAEYATNPYTHIIGTESGTVEYNLWRIADTSDGDYYYSEDGTNLEDIFINISGIINSGGFNQTRSAPAQPSPNAANVDKQAVSPAVDLSGYQTAKLSFSHKYNMLPGGNGGVIGVEVRDPPIVGPWKFLYIIPNGIYTGGLYFLENEYDGFGNQIKWCFNGVSGAGTYAWDRVELDIMPYIPVQYRSSVRVAFKYIQFGGGTGVGWYLDDVQLRVGRGNATLLAAHKDVWDMNYTTDRYGAPTHAWWSHDVAANGLKPGIDNALITTPIDLTSAVQVTLSAYFKFNINTAEGVPPDCLRVEVTPDKGASWHTLNLGVRCAWSLSNTGADIDDGKLDGKTYTGLNGANGWVSADTLTRLNVDLNSWRGKQIQLRFRIVTNNDASYAHYASNGAPWGVYIDDVTLTGLTKFN
ncbi:MAG: CARDB domain-containing protein [Methanobacteriota archaeon]